uniref:ribosomal protein S18 n=1 Tax=Timspurckia oligopyrenoides TaxID=708627 RepID=UPI001FCDAA2C|nr:ribosomal protein S18 [Timspurckia oligopyrenoides]UNJ17598.1 ribosomal protein S18 [Timspurckia oligopyrenoides]
MVNYKTKFSPIKPHESLDYKDIDLLKKFMNDQGKILPRSYTGVTCKQQKKISKAIKQARILSILPYTNRDS